MSQIQSICVYCGSGPGSDPAFVEAARTLGRTMAEKKIRLVFGGGAIGLMGEVARATLDHGGEILGIIPQFLTDRENKLGRGEIVVTSNMHERKQRMFEEADAFVALPGGIGTLEEIVEQLTWAQLGRHRKPILLANINRFWDPLCSLFDHMQRLAFLRPGLSVSYLVTDRADDIVPMLIEAAKAVPESETEMKASPAERM